MGRPGERRRLVGRWGSGVRASAGGSSAADARRSTRGRRLLGRWPPHQHLHSRSTAGAAADARAARGSSAVASKSQQQFRKSGSNQLLHCSHFCSAGRQGVRVHHGARGVPHPLPPRPPMGGSGARRPGVVGLGEHRVRHQFDARANARPRGRGREGRSSSCYLLLLLLAAICCCHLKKIQRPKASSQQQQ